MKSDLRSSDPKGDLETIARSRLYFGHQSVGGNVLEGLASLAKEHGVRLRIVEGPV